MSDDYGSTRMDGSSGTGGSEGGGPGTEAKSKGTKPKPDNLVIPPKKPKLSKAERRALQESQRAAKAAAAGVGGGGGKPSAKPHHQATKQPQHASKQQHPQHESTSSKGGGGGGGGSRATATTKTDPSKSAIETTISSRPRKTVASLAHLQPFIDPERHPERFSGVVLGGGGGGGGGGTSSSGGMTTKQQQQQQQLHPAVLRLGLEYAASTDLRGDNDRCRAMMHCFSRVLDDYVPPPPDEKRGMVVDVRRDLDAHVLKPSFQYWTEHCRPHCVSMGNAFSFFKTAVSSLPGPRDADHNHNNNTTNAGDADADGTWPAMRTELQESIDAFLKERISYAGKAIAQFASSKIQDGDVILTYGNPDVIPVILQTAAAEPEAEAATSSTTRTTAATTTTTNKTKSKKKKRFRVVVVDSRPLAGDGPRLIRKLKGLIDDLDCTYVLLPALSYVMRDVTKVLLGASALMSDGSIYAPVGTACVALCAYEHGVPVLACGETYKISHRVQLEAFTNNELGNPRDVLGHYHDGGGGGGGGENQDHDGTSSIPDNLRVINLLYDITPAEFISGIVTEMGILPPTSIAVLLRELNPQDSTSTI